MQWEISVTADTIIQHLLKFYDILWVIKAGLKENFIKLKVQRYSSYSKTCTEATFWGAFRTEYVIKVNRKWRYSSTSS